MTSKLYINIFLTWTFQSFSQVLLLNCSWTVKFILVTHIDTHMQILTRFTDAHTEERALRNMHIHKHIHAHICTHKNIHTKKIYRKYNFKCMLKYQIRHLWMYICITEIYICIYVLSSSEFGNRKLFRVNKYSELNMIIILKVLFKLYSIGKVYE